MTARPIALESQESQESQSFVGFPRAANGHDVGYYAFFARDCRTLMRDWLAERFSGLTVLPDDEAEAVSAAEEIAAHEIGRALRDHESRLLGEVIRDVLCARLVLRGDVERERGREIR